LIFRGWKAFFKLSVYFIPVILLFFPVLNYVTDTISTLETSDPLISREKLAYLIMKAPASPLLGFNKVPFEVYLKIVILFITSFFTFMSYYKSFRKDVVLGYNFNERIYFVLITAFIIVVLYLLGFTIFRTVYTDNYMVVAFPLFLMVFAVFYIRSYSFIRLFYVSMSMYYILILFLTYREPVKFYDFKSTAKYISEIEKNNEPILFYRNVLSIPFAYYYNGQNPLIPFPDPVNFDASVFLNNITDTSELKHAISRINIPSGSYILITDENTDYAFTNNYNRKMVADYLNAHYNSSFDTLYYGESKECYLRIRRFEKIQNK
jgi:hypothetical protein